MRARTADCFNASLRHSLQVEQAVGPYRPFEPVQPHFSQVLGENDVPIHGLYACGNDMNSVMGGKYPGPGITIGPGIAFAYAAVKHLSRQR